MRRAIETLSNITNNPISFPPQFLQCLQNQEQQKGKETPLQRNKGNLITKSCESERENGFIYLLLFHSLFFPLSYIGHIFSIPIMYINFFHLKPFFNNRNNILCSTYTSKKTFLCLYSS